MLTNGGEKAQWGRGKQAGMTLVSNMIGSENGSDVFKAGKTEQKEGGIPVSFRTC